MVKHYIIMSSSYKMGKRIAFDFAISGTVTADQVEDFMKEIQRECGEDASVSMHTVTAVSEKWDDVISADTFFEDIFLITEKKRFIEAIKADRQLEGLDVAKYILSQITCTHLKLEKLVYLCYADYLCKTKKKMFHDHIYAFKYGPIIESVYEHYKKYRAKEITLEDELEEMQDSSEIPQGRETRMSVRSRMLFSIDGIEKVASIDETLRKYQAESASGLVKITHSKGSPWEKTYSGEMYEEITDSVILENHCAEC